MLMLKVAVSWCFWDILPFLQYKHIRVGNNGMRLQDPV